MPQGDAPGTPRPCGATGDGGIYSAGVCAVLSLPSEHTQPTPRTAHPTDEGTGASGTTAGSLANESGDLHPPPHCGSPGPAPAGSADWGQGGPVGSSPTGTPLDAVSCQSSTRPAPQPEGFRGQALQPEATPSLVLGPGDPWAGAAGTAGAAGPGHLLFPQPGTPPSPQLHFQASAETVPLPGSPPSSLGWGRGLSSVGPTSDRCSRADGGHVCLRHQGWGRFISVRVSSAPTPCWAPSRAPAGSLGNQAACG